ncbi:RNA polymerase sigma factor [Paenibacillus mendelii]|uniref:RNA polymerase sigma factor n=1 Tax=Paenibacillus mendelii TaxID=206163 RepID=A0ABV6J3F2_9BACL|nr:sigma-70 family RNA polymerase sigma factor [Paenibacillus mendelii]MCQ6563286.1 sigma-70 family RNA polymerase sigma factor [Paenibacillus mendelii]
MDWKPIIYRYSLQLTGDAWDADDLTQDVLIKIVELAANNPHQPLTNAYVYRIVKNAWIDQHRKRRLHTVPIEATHEPSSPDFALSTREMLECLAERLPPKMTVILLLMDVFDFTAKETAEFVRLKEATVQVTLGRARARLKQIANSPVTEQQLRRPYLSKENEDQLNLDALVDAFKRRNPHDIHRAFIRTLSEGVSLTRLQASNAGLHFTFRDPDGNLFRILAK